MVDLSDVKVCEWADGCDLPAAYDLDGTLLCELHAEQMALSVLLAAQSGKWKKLPPPKVNGVDDEAVFTVDEAVKFLRSSRATMGRLMKDNQIPYHRMGRKPVFLKSELVNWVRRQGARQ